VIPFPANDHPFQPGHRIMVQVQSTWFPVIDRRERNHILDRDVRRQRCGAFDARVASR